MVGGRVSLRRRFFRRVNLSGSMVLAQPLNLGRQGVPAGGHGEISGPRRLVLDVGGFLERFLGQLPIAQQSLGERQRFQQLAQTHTHIRPFRMSTELE